MCEKIVIESWVAEVQRQRANFRKGTGREMKATWRKEYITRQELQQAEEQAKRRWKTLLVLLALALLVWPEAPVETKPTVVEKPAKPAAVAKVLLIDTDPASSKELTAVLEIGGFEVMACIDPEEGLRRVKDASMVILDEELPHSDEVCSRIREQSCAPIILLGSKPNGEAWDKAVAMGADAYLRRAVSRRELMARMRAILRRYRNVKYAEGGINDV